MPTTPLYFSSESSEQAIKRLVVQIMTHMDDTSLLEWMQLGGTSFPSFPVIDPSYLRGQVARGRLPIDMISLTGARHRHKLSLTDWEFIRLLKNAFHENLESILHYAQTTLRRDAVNGILAILEIPYLRLTSEEYRTHKTAIEKIVSQFIAADSDEEKQIQPFMRTLASNNLHPSGLHLHIDRVMHKLIARQYIRQFLTGDFVWRVHIGVTRMNFSMFGNFECIQTMPLPFTDEVED